VLTSASSSDDSIIQYSVAQVALPNITYTCPKLPEAQLHNTLAHYNTVYYTQPVVRQGLNEVILEAASFPQRIAALLPSSSRSSNTTTFNGSSSSSSSNSAESSGLYTVTVQYSTSHPTQTAVLDNSVISATNVGTATTTAAADLQSAVPPVCTLMTSGSVMICKWSAQVLIQCNNQAATARSVYISGMVHATFSTTSQQPTIAAPAAPEVLAAVTVQYDMASLCRQLETVTGCTYTHSMVPCDNVSSDASINPAVTSYNAASIDQNGSAQQHQQQPVAKRAKHNTVLISSIPGSVLSTSIPTSSSMYVAAVPEMMYGDSSSSVSDSAHVSSLFQG
jgi:hypothetical protein